MLPSAVMPLLPTPTTQDGANTAGPSQHDRNTPPLNTVVTLLPTPAAADGSGGRYGAEGHQMPLPGAVRLLPTPNTMDGLPPRDGEALDYVLRRGEDDGPRRTSTGNLREDVVRLLPTPAVNDMGEGKTVEGWDEWTDDMKAKHGNGNGHGASLAIEAQRLLPTPVVDPDSGNGHARDLGAEARLLPSPRVSGGNRNSRQALTGENSERHGRTPAGSASGLGLEQALEVAQGILPRELEPGDAVSQRLLPTPRVTQPGYADDGRGGRSLDVEARLLPTPTVTDHKASGSSQPRTSTHAMGTTLTDATVRQGDRWGEYAPAIHRWEGPMGREAPDPTQTSTQGNPQLAPPFVEWMMGLPAGHVTEVPNLTRNEKLKALGNGVVPQQVAAATHWILTVGLTAWKRVTR